MKTANGHTLSPFRDRVTDFRRVRAGDLKPNPRNWRQHPQAQRDALRGLLAEVGFAGAVLARKLADGSLELIDGHLRAEDNPDALLPVLVTDLDDAETAKLLATHDPLAAMAEANKEKLDALLREIDTGSAALQEMLAETAKEAGLYKTPEVQEDEIPDPPADPVTKAGDLIILGRHRLFCGNSTDPRDLQAVCPSMTWDVAVIDPPYEASVTAWLRWIMDPCIVFGQVKHLRLIPNHLWRFERVIVKRYKHRSATTKVAHRHAMLAQCGTVKVLPRANVTLDSVIEQEAKTEHDHQKPVQLLIDHLTHYTPTWKTVFDPYAGSGSTLLAAEAMGRDCVAVELDPGWCDVVVMRWEAASGKTAQRIANKDVEAYNAAARGAVTPRRPKHAKPAKEAEHV